MTQRVRVRLPVQLLALAASATLLIVACSGVDSEATQAAAATTAATTTQPAATQEATTAAVWASDVCGAIATWEDSVKTIAADIKNGISRDALSQGFADAEQATKDLADQLGAIGAPETDDGNKAKDDLVQLTSDVQVGVGDIKSAAEALGGSGAEGIATGVDEIKGDIEGLLKDAKQTFHQIRQLEPANELSTAIKNDETCQSLRPEE